MKGCKILVTGGAGFIGSNLIKRLEPDNEIYSIDNYTSGNVDNEIKSKNVVYYNADIKKDLSWFKDDEFDVIFHLAAKARIQPSFSKPLDYFSSNVMGTMKVADFASNKNIPIIFAGSSSHHSGKYKNPYTFTKDLSEDIMTMYMSIYNLKTTTARFYNVYGPNQIIGGRYATLMGQWMGQIMKNKPITIYGDGSKKRDFTHVDDIVTGLISIYDKQAWGYTLELGTGKNYSIKEISEFFNYNKIKYEDDRPGEAQSTLSKSNIEKDLIGWEPTDKIKDYIENWMRDINGKL